MIRTFISILLIGTQVALAGVATASQTERATAEHVLDRMAEALGGRERLTRLRNVRTKFRLRASGLEGTGESLVTATGESRTFYDLAGLDGELAVFDGERAWARDLNGKVRERMGPDLERDATDAYLGSFAFLLPGRRAGSVRLKGEDAAGTHYLLVAKDARGSEVTLYVDKATYLVDRQERFENDRVTASLPSDWREVDGVKFPFRTVQRSGADADTKFDVTVTVTDVATNVPVEATAFAKPAEGAPDYRFAAGSSATGIPFELTANHIFVQVRVNGSEPLWFLFDTGAEATAIDSAAAKALGLQAQGTLEARGNGAGTLEAALLKGVTLGVKGAEVLDQTVVAIPLSGIAEFEGRRIDGIVGYDFTSRFVVEIDYANRRVNLYEPKTYAYAGAGERLPITLIGNIPHVHAAIVPPAGAPVDGLFMVDTGSRLSLTLNSPFVKANAWAGDLAGKAVTAPYGIGVGGESTARVGRVSGLELGRFEVARPVTGFMLDEHGSQASVDSAGSIGGDILRRFDVIFDYSRSELILTPNAALAEPSEFDMLGVLLRQDPRGWFAIQRVVERSAADVAGLAPGDAITSIDGRPASELTLDEVRRMFGVDGRSLRLAVRRGDQTREVTVTLKRIV